jgi:hypothetical protein
MAITPEQDRQELQAQTLHLAEAMIAKVWCRLFGHVYVFVGHWSLAQQCQRCGRRRIYPGYPFKTRRTDA